MKNIVARRAEEAQRKDGRKTGKQLFLRGATLLSSALLDEAAALTVDDVDAVGGGAAYTGAEGGDVEVAATAPIDDSLFAGADSLDDLDLSDDEE
jgi:hypothetical protein